MKKISKPLGLVLASLLLFSMVLSGCGEVISEGTTLQTTAAPTGTKETTPAETTSPMPDTSKPLVVKGYMISADAPKIWDEVQAEVNKTLSAKINTTMQVLIVPSGDAKTKLPLINASGEEYDFMYTANYLGTYAPEVAKGAYAELTEEMIQRLMPRYYQVVDKRNIDLMKINGKIYCVPQVTVPLNYGGIVVRKDLREKYGMAPIQSTADLDKFMEAVAQNETGVIPYNISKGEATTSIVEVLLKDYLGDCTFTIPGMYTLMSLGEDETGRVYSLLDKDFYDAYKKMADKMKEWYDKGYIPKNPFSNTVASGESQVQGKSAITRTQINNFAANYPRAKGNGYELEFYPITSSKGRVYQQVASQGFVLRAGSKNIERTLMMMDYICEEPSIVEALEYGLLNKSYIVKDDGRIDFPEGVNPANVPYKQGIVSFWFTDNNFKKPKATWPQQKIDLDKEYAEKTFSPALNGITLNMDNLKTEVAAIKNIDAVEGDALRVGMVENVETALDDYLKKLKLAGYEKLVDEVKKQSAEFVKNKRK